LRGRCSDESRPAPLRKVDQLGWMSFVASTVQSAAWPAAAFVIVTLGRRAIERPLSRVVVNEQA